MNWVKVQNNIFAINFKVFQISTTIYLRAPKLHILSQIYPKNFFPIAARTVPLPTARLAIRQQACQWEELFLVQQNPQEFPQNWAQEEEKGRMACVPMATLVSCRSNFNAPSASLSLLTGSSSRISHRSLNMAAKATSSHSGLLHCSFLGQSSSLSFSSKSAFSGNINTSSLLFDFILILGFNVDQCETCGGYQDWSFIGFGRVLPADFV